MLTLSFAQASRAIMAAVRRRVFLLLFGEQPRLGQISQEFVDVAANFTSLAVEGVRERRNELLPVPAAIDEAPNCRTSSSQREKLAGIQPHNDDFIANRSF